MVGSKSAKSNIESIVESEVELYFDPRSIPKTEINYLKKRDFEIGLPKLTVRKSPASIGRFMRGFVLRSQFRVAQKVKNLPLVKCRLWTAKRFKFAGIAYILPPTFEKYIFQYSKHNLTSIRLSASLGLPLSI